MKKINAFYVAALFASLLLVSCGKPKPEKVALKFYQAVITNDISKAKEYCLPSATEEIERLEKIDVYKNNVNEEPLQLMEVVVKNPNYSEGDTAIVNYKINNFKSFLTLIMKDGEWRIAYSYELRYLTELEFESSTFYDLFNKNPKIFWNNYQGLRFTIKNVAMETETKGIAYSKSAKMIYVRNYKKTAYIVQTLYKMFGEKVNYNDKLEPYLYGGIYERPTIDYYILNGLSVDDESKIKIAKKLSEGDQISGANDIYDIQNLVDFSGRLLGMDEIYEMQFDNCSILHVTSN